MIRILQNIRDRRKKNKYHFVQQELRRRWLWALQEEPKPRGFLLRRKAVASSPTWPSSWPCWTWRASPSLPLGLRCTSAGSTTSRPVPRTNPPGTRWWPRCCWRLWSQRSRFYSQPPFLGGYSEVLGFSAAMQLRDDVFDFGRRQWAWTRAYDPSPLIKRAGSILDLFCLACLSCPTYLHCIALTAKIAYQRRVCSRAPKAGASPTQFNLRTLSLSLSLRSLAFPSSLHIRSLLVYPLMLGENRRNPNP